MGRDDRLVRFAVLLPLEAEAVFAESANTPRTHFLLAKEGFGLTATQDGQLCQQSCTAPAARARR